MPKWIDKLQKRWGLKSVGQVIIILIVFAFTGTTVMLIKKPITSALFQEGQQSTWFTVAYWILIFPIYNILLLAYGFVFGQFAFFWKYEKRFLNRLAGKRTEGNRNSGEEPSL